MKVQKFIISWFRFKVRLLAIISQRWAGNVAFKIFCTPYYNLLYKRQTIPNIEQLVYHYNGIKTTGYRWGGGGNRKILIAHGFRSSAIKFEYFANKLAAKGYEVIAFDAPAHNMSDGKQLTAIDYKDFVFSLNKHFGPFEGYLTHSFGGLAVCMNLAEMPSNKNIKTILIAPAANSKTIIELFFKRMDIINKKVQRYFYDNIKRLSGKDIEWFSVNRCLPDIKGDVLWIHDVDDKVTPVVDAQDAQKMNYPNLLFFITKGLGHRRIYRDEKVVDAVMRFL